MNGDQILSRLESIDERMGSMEQSIKTINFELGLLTGKVGEIKNSRVTPLLIKFVICPLIFIVGALVGIKLFLPL